MFLTIRSRVSPVRRRTLEINLLSKFLELYFYERSNTRNSTASSVIISSFRLMDSARTVRIRPRLFGCGMTLARPLRAAALETVVLVETPVSLGNTRRNPPVGVLALRLILPIFFAACERTATHEHSCATATSQPLASVLLCETVLAAAVTAAGSPLRRVRQPRAPP